MVPILAPKRLWRPALAYAALCVALWPVPLLNRLHAESAAVVALASFFVAGWAALGSLRRGERLRRVLLRQEALVGVPGLLLTVPVAWAPNCGYAQGLLLFLTFVPVTVALAVGLAFALDAAGWRGARWWLGGLGLVLALAGPLYDLGLHPQFYTYNHVFGGVLGPIYDEELAVRPGLFVFRGMTLLWTALLVVAGRWLHGRRHPRVLLALVLMLGAGYTFSGPLGINTPTWWLQRQLGQRMDLGVVVLHLEPGSVSDGELRRLADAHRYQVARLREALEVAPQEPVHSYLYPDEDAKARLVGARRTAVAPVWLAEPQTHVLLEDVDAVLPHEMAHAFSRPFGLPLVRASVSIGLVEGLAVALEPPDGRPSPSEQVSAAYAQGVALEEGRSLTDLADQVAARLSPTGFWGGRGAVSYTVMGSFVRYLLDAYGPAPLREAYAWADFERAYGKSIEVLAEEWAAWLRALPYVDRAAAPVARQRFARPSLFEQDCPHYVPRHRRATRAARMALADGDTLRADELLAEALTLVPTYQPALATWADLRLLQGEAEAVAVRLDTLEARSLALDVRLADALALLGQPEAARTLYREAFEALPRYAHASRLIVALRDSVAARPEVFEALLRIDDHPARARSWSPTDAPVQALRGLALLDEAPDDALTALQAARQELTTPAWRRTLLALQAQAHYRLTNLVAAQAAARQAAAAYRTQGDLNEARRLTAFADKMQWLEETSA